MISLSANKALAASFLSRMRRLPKFKPQSLQLSDMASMIQDISLLDVGVVGIVGGLSLRCFQLWKALAQERKALEQEKLNSQAAQAISNGLEVQIRSLEEENSSLKESVELQTPDALKKRGEETLKWLLDYAQEQGSIESYELKPKVGAGIPDAIATFRGGRKIAIDSKAVNKPSNIDRKTYVTNLKAKAADLSARAYSGKISNSYDAIFMLLPRDRDLQCAYNEDTFVDDHALHKYANERGVLIVSPESFLADLKVFRLIHSEDELRETEKRADKNVLFGPILNQIKKEYMRFQKAHKFLNKQEAALTQTLDELYSEAAKTFEMDQAPSKPIKERLKPRPSQLEARAMNASEQDDMPTSSL